MKSEICKLEERKIQKEKRYKNIMMSFCIEFYYHEMGFFPLLFLLSCLSEERLFCTVLLFSLLPCFVFFFSPSFLSQFCQLSSRSVYFVDLFFFCVCVCLHFFFSFFTVFGHRVSFFFFPPSLFLKPFFFLFVSLFACAFAFRSFGFLCYCLVVHFAFCPSHNPLFRSTISLFPLFLFFFFL